jgi:hypothetical protein
MLRRGASTNFFKRISSRALGAFRAVIIIFIKSTAISSGTYIEGSTYPPVWWNPTVPLLAIILAWQVKAACIGVTATVVIVVGHVVAVVGRVVIIVSRAVIVVGRVVTIVGGAGVFAPAISVGYRPILISRAVLVARFAAGVRIWTIEAFFLVFYDPFTIRACPT